MSQLAFVVVPRRRILFAALLALAAAACGQNPTAPRAARAPRFDTVPTDTVHRPANYENPGV